MSNRIEGITGVVLAGGKGSRMRNTDKSRLSAGTETFVDLSLKSLSFCGELMIISNNPHIHHNRGADVYPDIFPDCGPLGGLYTGLKKAKNNRIILLACDMPFVTEALMRRIASYPFEGNALLPIAHGRQQPICAVYSTSLIPLIEEFIEKKEFMIVRMLDKTKVDYLDLSAEDTGNHFININTPSDYERYIKPFRS